MKLKGGRGKEFSPCWKAVTPTLVGGAPETEGFWGGVPTK